MDSNGWRSAQSGVEHTMDTGCNGTDWRNQLPPDSRQRIVNKITDTLKTHLPFSGQEVLHELKLIASRFEEKIYTAATSQFDYLRKISLKMLTMEIKYQNTTATSLPANSASNSKNPPDADTTECTAGKPYHCSLSLKPQSAMNALQANLTTLQSSSNMLQHQMMQTQLKHLLYQQRQHIIHKQHLLQQQQLHQQTQQVNINSLSSQSGMNALQANPTPLPANSASNSENPPEEEIYPLEDIIRLLEI